MTGRFTDYEIRYFFEGDEKHFIQRDTQMTEADAWYYAVLHSGIGLRYGGNTAADKDALLREHARRHQLTDVRVRAIN